jgi:hypothetical protein
MGRSKVETEMASPEAVKRKKDLLSTCDPQAVANGTACWLIRCKEDMRL